MKSHSFLAIAAIGDEDQLAVAVGQQLARMQQPVKVIHKEHEAVTGKFEFPTKDLYFNLSI